MAANLVLVDLALRGMSGLELVQALQVRQPDLPCLILSGYSEVTYVQQAFDAGARGYVLKGKPPDILEGIQAVAGGRTYLSPAIRAKLSGGGG